jgi:hypothetical protein
MLYLITAFASLEDDSKVARPREIFLCPRSPGAMHGWCNGIAQMLHVPVLVYRFTRATAGPFEHEIDQERINVIGIVWTRKPSFNESLCRIELN